MTSPSFVLIPDVAIKGGEAQLPPPTGMTLVDPEYGRATDVADKWTNQGARQLLIIDQEAEDGDGDNSAEVAKITQMHANTLISGGIDSQAKLDAALKTKAAQIVLATNSLNDKPFVDAAVAAHGDRLTMQIDVINTNFISAPGTAMDNADLWQTLTNLKESGISRYILNHISHQHGNHHEAMQLAEQFVTTVRRQTLIMNAVTHIEDLHRFCELAPKGLHGAIIGKPLNEGVFTYAEAHSAVQARFDMFVWGPASP